MNSRFITKTLLAIPTSLGIALGLCALNREIAIGAKFEQSYTDIQHPFQPLATPLQPTVVKVVADSSLPTLPLSSTSAYSPITPLTETESAAAISYLLFQPNVESLTVDWYWVSHANPSFSGAMNIANLEEEYAGCSPQSSNETINRSRPSKASEAKEVRQRFNHPEPDMTLAFESYIDSVASSGIEWAF